MVSTDTVYSKATLASSERTAIAVGTEGMEPTDCLFEVGAVEHDLSSIDSAMIDAS